MMEHVMQLKQSMEPLVWRDCLAVLQGSEEHVAQFLLRVFDCTVIQHTNTEDRRTLAFP